MEQSSFVKTVKNETRRSDHACSEKLEFFPAEPVSVFAAEGEFPEKNEETEQIVRVEKGEYICIFHAEGTKRIYV